LTFPFSTFEIFHVNVFEPEANPLTVVLYADNKFNDKDIPEYFLNAVKEETSAKCPPDLLGNGVIKIDNDCQKVFEKILEFVK
jgi:hypothetical protein